MKQSTLRFALALLTSAVGLGTLYVVYRERTRPDHVGFVRTAELGARTPRLHGADGAEETVGTGELPLDAARPADASRLPSVLEVELPRWPASTFRREPLLPGDAARLFQMDPEFVRYDPDAYFTHRPGLDLERSFPEHPDGGFRLRTNELGLREDEPLRREPPDLRILITGDSHVDGVCNNDEAFGNLLEGQLAAPAPGRSIETLNAGKGGYTFYHYLGTLERFLPLAPDVFVVTIYGGNDFLEGLFMYHHFAGTQASPGAGVYGAELDRARAIHAPSVAQAFQSLKYFDQNPHEVEVALQMARDVCTEIQVTCLRAGVEPLFVYLPPYTDVEWEEQRDVAEPLAEALGLSPAGRASTGRMADSLLAFLRDRGLSAVDLRPAFEAAGPGHYWRADEHVNLRAMRRIADELLRVLGERRVLERSATRPAPALSAQAREEALLALRSPGANRIGRLAPVPVAPGERPESARRLTPEEVETLFELDDERIYDPRALVAYAPGLAVARSGDGPSWTLRTNAAGFRDDEEPRDQAPDLRVLIAGDENVAGAWDNAASFGNVLERALADERPELTVECLHAAVEGHSFPSYLGVLERELELRPDVFVVTVSGGTDLLELYSVASVGRDVRAPRDLRLRLGRAAAIAPGPVEQGLRSLAFFHDRAGVRPWVRDAAVAVTVEIQRLCLASGIRLVLVYVPTAYDVEPERHAPVLDEVLPALGVPEEGRGDLAAFAHATLERIRRSGVEVIDLGETFAAADVALYGAEWRLNEAAQRRIAERLLPVLRSELPRRRR